MNPNLLLSVALVLSGGLLGCSTAQHNRENALAIAIALPDTPFNGSKPRISINTNNPTPHFHVVISNNSATPQYVVQDQGCSIGYKALSFELTDDTGKQYVIRRAPLGWVSDGLNWWILEPGGQYVIEVNFGEVFQGHRAWDGFPANLHDGHFHLKAVFKPATEGLTAQSFHVAKDGRNQTVVETKPLWHGQIESVPVGCEVVNW